MKLSAKTRYAARILLYLAKYGIERPISSSKLALRAVFEARAGGMCCCASPKT